MCKHQKRLINGAPFLPYRHSFFGLYPPIKIICPPWLYFKYLLLKRNEAIDLLTRYIMKNSNELFIVVIKRYNPVPVP